MLVVSPTGLKDKNHTCRVMETSPASGDIGVIGIRKESTTINVLDQHNSLQHSKYCLYTHRYTCLPSLVKETSLYRKWDHNRKPQLDTMQRSVDYSHPTSQLLHIWPREHHRRVPTMIVRTRNTKNSAVKQSFWWMSAEKRLEQW